MSDRFELTALKYGEESVMKIAPRIVSAALALAAIVGLPLAQPAHAAGAPDLRHRLPDQAGRLRRHERLRPRLLQNHELRRRQQWRDPGRADLHLRQREERRSEAGLHDPVASFGPLEPPVVRLQAGLR